MNEPLPWFPLYVDRFRSSRRTMRMSSSSVGIFVLLLMEEWVNGPIPDDDDALAFIGRNTNEGVREVLKSCFVLTADGWVNEPLEGLRSEQEAKHSRRVEAGKKGGRPRKQPVAPQPPTSPPKAILNQSLSGAEAIEENRVEEETTHTARDEVFGNFDDLAIASIKGLYGWDDREGTDERVWGSTPTPDRRRLIQIAVLRIEGEGKTFNGVFFRAVLLKVIAEQSTRDTLDDPFFDEIRGEEVS